MESFPAMYDVKTQILKFLNRVKIFVYLGVYLEISLSTNIFSVTFMIPHLLKMSGVIRETSDESDESNMDIADLRDVRGVKRDEDRGPYRK